MADVWRGCHRAGGAAPTACGGPPGYFRSGHVAGLPGRADAARRVITATAPPQHEHRGEKARRPDQRAPRHPAQRVGRHVEHARAEIDPAAGGGEGRGLLRQRDHDHGEAKRISASKWFVSARCRRRCEGHLRLQRGAPRRAGPGVARAHSRLAAPPSGRTARLQEPARARAVSSGVMRRRSRDLQRPAAAPSPTPARRPRRSGGPVEIALARNAIDKTPVRRNGMPAA